MRYKRVVCIRTLCSILFCCSLLPRSHLCLLFLVCETRCLQRCLCLLLLLEASLPLLVVCKVACSGSLQSRETVMCLVCPSAV